jgi:hypothetical protein
MGNNKVTIFNIYNDCNYSDTLICLCNFIQGNRDTLLGGVNGCMIWAGDFNCHHPLWDRDQDNHLFTPQALWEAGTLIELVANEGTEIALP